MMRNGRNSSLCVVFTKWIVLFFLIKGIVCTVKLVSLNVPARVKKGSEVQLSCLYDLGNASLYSLKWFYRNHKNPEEQEFFRYTPRSKPVKQVFPLEGINVDLYKSEGGTVYITETKDSASGNYKCEISVEGTFQTVAAEKLMTVEANRASHLPPPLMDGKILCIQLLCTCLAILSWIGSKHLSIIFSPTNTSASSPTATNATKTTSNDRNNPLILSLIDCRTEYKCLLTTTQTTNSKTQ